MRALMLVTVLVTICDASVSDAGSCEGYELEQVARIEAYARTHAGELVVDPLCLDVIEGTQLAARVVKACDTILARSPDQRACAESGVALGAKVLGGRLLSDNYISPATTTTSPHRSRAS